MDNIDVQEIIINMVGIETQKSIEKELKKDEQKDSN